MRTQTDQGKSSKSRRGGKTKEQKPVRSDKKEIFEPGYVLGFTTDDGIQKAPSHLNANQFVLSSSSVRKEPGKWTLLDLKTVDQATTHNVQSCLSEIQAASHDLTLIATNHPNSTVAGLAQMALVDVAALVLRTWPQDSFDSVQPIFNMLYAAEKGVFKKRWKLLHVKGGRSAGSKNDGSKRAILSCFIMNNVWMKYQTSCYDVALELAGLRQMKFNPILHDRDFIALLQEFLKQAPALMDGLCDQHNVLQVVQNAALQHFDLFWETVVEPYSNNGSHSRWQQFVDGRFSGSKAWSKSCDEMKRILLHNLRQGQVGAIVKTSVDT